MIGRASADLCDWFLNLNTNLESINILPSIMIIVARYLQQLKLVKSADSGAGRRLGHRKPAQCEQNHGLVLVLVVHRRCSVHLFDEPVGQL